MVFGSCKFGSAGSTVRDLRVSASNRYRKSGASFPIALATLIAFACPFAWFVTVDMLVSGVLLLVPAWESAAWLGWLRLLLYAVSLFAFTFPLWHGLIRFILLSSEGKTSYKETFYAFSSRRRYRRVTAFTNRRGFQIAFETVVAAVGYSVSKSVFDYFAEMGEGIVGLILLIVCAFGVTVIWLLLVSVNGKFFLADVIFVSRPDLTGAQALYMSEQVCRSHRNEIFSFKLSFLPWLLLSVVTLGIPALFLVFPLSVTARPDALTVLDARGLTAADTENT